jgi:SCY1-like protein 1
MALMATVEYYEPEDLVGKVIPGMAVCLLDKEKTVRDQAFKALDMFLERVRKAASEMVCLCLEFVLSYEKTLGRGY